MAKKSFINFRDEILSFPLLEKNVGIFKPGRYSGFNTIASVSGLIVRIGHTGAIKKTLIDGQQEAAYGSFLTPTGTIVHDNGTVDLTISSNAGNPNPRIDYMVAEHIYSAVQGGIECTYFILQGDNNGADPVVANDKTQVKLAKIVIAANGTTYANLTFSPIQPPFLGDTLPTQVYDFIKALILPDIPLTTTSVDGLITLATSAEALAGIITNKGITPATLKAVIDALPAAEIVPDASTTVKGRIEIATQTEVNNETDTVRAVVPATQSVYVAAKIAAALATLNLTGLHRERNYGTFTPGNIPLGNVGSTHPISGDITRAEITQKYSNGNIITLTFANPMDNTNYQLRTEVESLGTMEYDNDVKLIPFKVLSTTQASIYLEETGGVVQNLKIHIAVIQR